MGIESSPSQRRRRRAKKSRATENSCRHSLRRSNGWPPHSGNASIDFATCSAELDLGLLEFKPSNKDEGLPLPQFIKDIVKAKGIPLTNNLSVAAPDVQWNWKTNTLGKFIVRFNISTK